MVTDHLFYSEKKPFRKIALLFTIPCAIVPIMMATAGIMSIPFSPLFFKYDFILWGMVYFIYTYGLFISWLIHRNWLPFLVFVVHLTFLFFFVFWVQEDWLAYAAIVSIIATSLSNQYFRLGSFECHECSNPFMEKNNC